MVLGNSLLRQFDSSHEIRGGVSAAAEALGPGALGPGAGAGDLPRRRRGLGPTHAQTLAAVRKQMAQAPNIVSVSPPVFADDNRSALLSAVLSVDPEDMGARDTVDWMRAQLPEAANGSAQRDVGGPTALIKDFDDRVSATQPLVFGLRRADRVRDAADLDPVGVPGAQGRADDGAVGGRRLRQPGGGLPVGLAGRARASRRSRSIDSTVPPLVLAMTFGLSMDYEIFLLTRIRERFLQTGQHPRRGRLRREHQRAHHHQRGADHDRGVHRLRVRRHAAGRRDRRGVRGRDRGGRHRGAAGAGAGADGDVRRVELVAAALAGPHPAVGGLREAAARRSTSATS